MTAESWWEECLFHTTGNRSSRKPTLLFSSVFLWRWAARRFLGLLFQKPPRTTRPREAVQAFVKGNAVDAFAECKLMRLWKFRDRQRQPPYKLIVRLDRRPGAFGVVGSCFGCVHTYTQLFSKCDSSNQGASPPGPRTKRRKKRKWIQEVKVESRRSAVL
jgi:hypothetical protein